SLERLRVAAGRDLAICLLARQPDLDVIGLCRGKPHVSRAQQHRAKGQLQLLQHLLSVCREGLQLRVRGVRSGQFHELDLVELMLANEAAYVLSVRPGFTSET